MLGPSQPAWLVLLAIALTPAVCEEFLFRGFVLTAFDRPGRRRMAVVLSAIAFGAVHMLPQQVFYATLLGLVLGLLAIRTQSIWPGLAFHFTFNGIAVLRERWTASEQLPAWSDVFLSVDGDNLLQFNWPLLAIAAVVSVSLLVLVCRWPLPRTAQ